MNGDIDNRLKTMFDALQMRQTGQDVGSEAPGSDEDPMFVLVQNDSMIANVSVTTDRLLDIPKEFEYASNYAVLVLDVKVETTRNVTSNYYF